YELIKMRIGTTLVTENLHDGAQRRHGASQCVDAIAEMRVDQQCDRLGIAELQRHLFGGQPKIDRHHHGARPRNCKITGVETIAVERQQRHAIAGAHATCGQAAGYTRNIISNLRPGALAPFKLRGNTVTVDLRRTADQSGERQHDEYLLLALFSFKFMQYSLWRCTPAAPRSSLRAMRLSTA